MVWEACFWTVVAGDPEMEIWVDESCSSLGFGFETPFVCPYLDELDKKLGTIWIEVFDDYMFLFSVAVPPFVAVLGIDACACLSSDFGAFSHAWWTPYPCVAFLEIAFELDDREVLQCHLVYLLFVSEVCCRVLVPYGSCSALGYFAFDEVPLVAACFLVFLAEFPPLALFLAIVNGFVLASLSLFDMCSFGKDFFDASEFFFFAKLDVALEMGCSFPFFRVFLTENDVIHFFWIKVDQVHEIDFFVLSEVVQSENPSTSSVVHRKRRSSLRSELGPLTVGRGNFQAPWPG